MGMLLAEIEAILQLPVKNGNLVEIHWLGTDTRQITTAATTLFIALKTGKRDGHQYLEKAYALGVRNFIVSKAYPLPDLSGATFLPVADPLQAMQDLVATHRKKIKIPVAGITGSNGKTIVKEWLFQVLEPDYLCCRNPRSYNSQIGVPLSVWALKPSHQLGLFEAGISTTGEMDKLEKVIQPTLGIFTNLGAAHDEGFASRQEKLTEKWKLFTHTEAVICHTDDPLVAAAAKSYDGTLIDWGKGPNCWLRILNQKTDATGTDFECVYAGQPFAFRLPFTDEASVENGLHCLTAGLYLGINVNILQERMQHLQALNMRLEWKKGILQSLLLNDSYSHDMVSLEIALNHLQQQSGHHKPVAILSDLPGKPSPEDYQRVADLLGQKGIRHLMGVGKTMRAYEVFFYEKNIETTWYADTDALLEQADRTILEKAVVLIKGARVFAFEKIVAALQQQQHETLLEINLSNLTHNLNIYRGSLPPGVKMMVMLKAFGYGSTDAELGRRLQYEGVEYLAVAYTDEGIALRQGGVRMPIMVMNPEPGDFASLLSYELEPELYAPGILKAFIFYLNTQGKTQYPIHLKLDTGMHRLGFGTEDLPELLELLKTQPLICVKTAFTHLVASENPTEDAFTEEQANLFRAACGQLEQALGYSFIKHAANTAAITRHPNLHFDMVRLGIGLFGISGAFQLSKLLPVSRLLTTVAQVKTVAAGETVGYGRKAILTRDSKIATVRIGYADGYRRQLSNGVGYMYLRNQRVPVVGNVCMDMTMLDVTDLPEVLPGDRVEVFGPHIPVKELAALCNTIPYEILTGISQRVKRILVEE